MDWYQDHKSFQSHANQVAEASAAWQMAHPGEVLNYDLARKDYEQAYGLEPGYLLLGKFGNQTTEKLKNNLKMLFPCPECGEGLEMELMVRCSQVNPKHYTACFLHSEDDACQFHFYTRTKLLDLQNYVKLRQFDQVDQVRGVL